MSLRTKPISAARAPGLKWLEATINMAEAFGRREINIKAYRVPENEQGAEGAANIEKLIAHTLVLPLMAEALTDLETPEAEEAGYWLSRKQLTIEHMLETHVPVIRPQTRCPSSFSQTSSTSRLASSSSRAR